MCSPDPNAGARRAAEERQAAKHAKFGSESIKYWNRETTYKRGKEASALGFSRSKSDAYVKAYVNEGGRGARAGRNTLHKLLQQTSQIDKASNEAFGRNYDILFQGIQREYITRQAKNRSRLGAKPEWGAPVMMPPQDKAGQFLATLQTGLSIASSVMTLGTADLAKAAAGTVGGAGTKKTIFSQLGIGF